MPLGDGRRRLPREDAQEGHAERCCGRGQVRAVCRAADAVEDDARQPQRRVEVTKAPQHGRRAPRRTAGVDHEHDGQPEGLGERGAAPLLAVAPEAVEEPHHPLDDRDIAPACRAPEDAPVLLGRQHPRIQRARHHPAHRLVVPGIDEVGTHLEGLDSEPALAERREERERDRRLADAAGRAGDDEGLHGRRWEVPPGRPRCCRMMAWKRGRPSKHSTGRDCLRSAGKRRSARANPPKSTPA